MAARHFAPQALREMQEDTDTSRPSYQGRHFGSEPVEDVQQAYAAPAPNPVEDEAVRLRVEAMFLELEGLYAPAPVEATPESPEDSSDAAPKPVPQDLEVPSLDEPEASDKEERLEATLVLDRAEAQRVVQEAAPRPELREERLADTTGRGSRLEVSTNVVFEEDLPPVELLSSSSGSMRRRGGFFAAIGAFIARLLRLDDH